MRSARQKLIRFAATTAALPVLAFGLVACGTEETSPTDPTAEETTLTTATEPTAPDTETTATSPESPRDTATTTARTTEDSDEGDEGVREVAEEFEGLVPASVFEQLDTCNPSVLEDSWQCNGAEIGQFQFSTGSAKALSATQALTGLRSSRVVEDTGDRVVGWSTLGTTSVITVVDNDQGQVMQQMVSSDREDPEEIIYELGLAQRPAGETTTPTTNNESA